MAIIGQTARPRAGRQAALRAPRRDRDRRQRLADRGEHHVQEARRRRRRDRARRQGRRRRLHEDDRRRADAGGGDDRARRPRGPQGRLPADRHGPAARAARSATRSRSARRSRRSRGEGPPDFSELVLASAAHLLALSDLGIDEPRARRVAEEAVADGSALAAYERWIEAQGGDPGPRLAAEGAGRPRGDRSRRRRRPAARCDRDRPCRPPPRRRPADEGGSRSTTRSASSAGRSGATRSCRGACSPRCTRGRGGRGGGRRRGAGAYELGDEPRRRPADRPRHASVPELPEVETERGRLAARLEGRRIASARIDDPRLTRPDDPAWIAARADRRTRRRGRAAGQVPDRPPRRRAGAARPPADDRRVPVRARQPRAGRARARRRHADRLPRPPPLRHVAPARPGGGRGAPRRTARPGAARARVHGRLPRRAPGGPAGAGQGRDPRPADRRRAREHLRRRGALACADPSAAAGRRALRRRDRGACARASGGRCASASAARGPISATATYAGGRMQHEFRVYGRTGEPCDRCGTPIEKTRAGGRGTLVLPTAARL